MATTRGIDKMKHIFISAPYRADTINGVYENIQRARALAVKCLRLGWYPETPHMNTAFMDGVVDDEVFLQGAIEVMLKCDAVVFAHGWELSRGCQEESNAAVEAQLVIYDEDAYIPTAAYFEANHG